MGWFPGNAAVPRIFPVRIFLYMEEGGAELGRITQNLKLKIQNL
jgi:hypothetical protein